MKKKLASLAAAMALTAVMGGTAMAAEGSLADVPKDHWSYEAVNQLVKDGIIEGMLMVPMLVTVLSAVMRWLLSWLELPISWNRLILLTVL